MLVGWINVYLVPDLVSSILWIFIGLTALLLLGFQFTGYLLSRRDKSSKSIRLKAQDPFAVRVLPEGSRWEAYTDSPLTIQEISQAAIEAATGPIVSWQLIAPLLKTQEARDVVQESGQVYLYKTKLTPTEPQGV